MTDDDGCRAGAPDCSAAAARVCDFYRELTPRSLRGIDAVYAYDAVFADPAGEARGLPAIRAHFAELLRNVSDCRFNFLQTLTQGERAALVWEMTLCARRLNGGKPFVVRGASVLLFADGRVARHEDFFDLGALLYERLPLLGAITRRLRARVAAGA